MSPTSRNRIAAALAGALAGVAGWALVDVVPDALDAPRAILALSTGAAAFFFVLLVTLGPLSPGRAGLAGAIVAVPATALMVLASHRFDAVDAFLETVHPLVALAVLMTVPVPYLISGLGPRRRWLDYAGLFDAAWAALVRCGTALVFLLVAWGVIWLSDTVLKIVGLTVIEDIVDMPPVPWIATGLIFGLALAVADELSDYVSPRLPLRLLRLLAPPVLGVIVLFLVFLPFRGLSNLFGDLSAAATLMAMAVTAATLVSSALDRDDGAAAAGLIRRTAAGLALLLPIMAGLSVVAVTERVGQYGWTPDRLAAVVGAALLTAYGIAYAAAVLGRHGWMGRIRWANARLALLAVVLAAVWLTPVLDAQRISVASQIARYESGRTPLSNLDLWTLGREWGRAGRDGIDRLAALDLPNREDVARSLEALDTARSRAEFESLLKPVAELPDLGTLRAVLPVLPEGARLPEGLLEGREAREISDWLRACLMRTPEGHPGCAAVSADFIADRPGDEVILFTMVSDSFVSATALVPGDRFGAVAGDIVGFARVESLDRLHAGDARISTKRLNVLTLGEDEIFLLP